MNSIPTANDARRVSQENRMKNRLIQIEDQWKDITKSINTAILRGLDRCCVNDWGHMEIILPENIAKLEALGYTIKDRNTIHF